MAKHNLTADRNADADRADEVSPRANASSQAGRKKDRQMTASAHWLFQFGLYKKTQGRITRQLTFFALLASAAVGCWRLGVLLMDRGPSFQYGLPLLLMVICGWCAFRIVNHPKFADFLIAVEAEMAKVSWPTRQELVRSSAVVMIVIFGLAAILALYDLFWNWLLHRLTGG